MKRCPRCKKPLHLWRAHPEKKMPAQWGHEYSLAEIMGKGTVCDYTENAAKAAG